MPAQLDNKDYSTKVDFTEDQEKIHFFRNRRKDDLSEYLKGATRWTEYQPSRKSSYKIPVNSRWFSIEYINNEWYYTTWDDSKESYAVVGEDQISKPYELGLGTKALPYETREPSPSESEDSPKEASEGQEEPKSDQDTPTVTRQQTEDLDTLAERLEDETGIGYPHTVKYTINPIFDRDEREVENYQVLSQRILQQMSATTIVQYLHSPTNG